MDSPDSAPKLSFLHPEGDGVRILTLGTSVQSAGLLAVPNPAM